MPEPGTLANLRISRGLVSESASKVPVAKNKGAGRIRMLANGTSLPVELGQYQGHFTSGGSDDRMELTLPPVFSPNVVPLS
jgi:hypothetical protein